jgi:AcrR family transcriptional regulator
VDLAAAEATDAVVRAGRPRDPSLDVAIVGAALELLAEGGYGALTMEAVAARAGVGKATLYRRWPAKEQLVVDALSTLAAPDEPDPGAAPRDALVVLLEGLRRGAGSLSARIWPRLLSEAADHPEVLRRYREQVHDPRRRRFRAVLQRAVEAGQVRADVDLDHAVDLLVGPVVYRNLVRSEQQPGAEFVARVVDDVLRGLAPGVDAPRPDRSRP